MQREMVLFVIQELPEEVDVDTLTERVDLLQKGLTTRKKRLTRAGHS